jgi:hypothetical protein
MMLHLHILAPPAHPSYILQHEMSHDLLTLTLRKGVNDVIHVHASNATTAT